MSKMSVNTQAEDRTVAARAEEGVRGEWNEFDFKMMRL